MADRFRIKNGLEYRVIECSSSLALGKNVTEALSNGWRLHYGLVISGKANQWKQTMIYCQVMVRSKEER